MGVSHLCGSALTDSCACGGGGREGRRCLHSAAETRRLTYPASLAREAINPRPQLTSNHVSHRCRVLACRPEIRLLGYCWVLPLQASACLHSRLQSLVKPWTWSLEAVCIEVAGLPCGQSSAQWQARCLWGCSLYLCLSVGSALLSEYLGRQGTTCTWGSEGFSLQAL